MSTAYAIRSYSWVVRDEPEKPDPRLAFHLQSGDYLATISTFMGLLSDGLRGHIERKESPLPMYIDMLEQVRKDLYYVHKNYTIKQKDNTPVDR